MQTEIEARGDRFPPDEALNRSSVPHWSLAEADAAVSPYLRQPPRKLFDACRAAGRDRAGRMCPICQVRKLCEAGRSR